MSERELLRRTAEIAADFIETLDRRAVWPSATVDELRVALGGPVPDHPIDALDVIEELARDAERGVVAIPSGRYFGFVIGGALPAALAADWLTSTWDQNAGLVVGGPAAAVAEEVAGEWLKELFGLPATTSFAFVTGCQMAHVTCLAAARHAVLERAGWEVVRRGLFGAPPLVNGVAAADSWATDAHKWLNVPYDCGLAFVAHAEAHRAAMAMTADYLVANPNAARDQMDWTPEFSRRARGVPVYAALRSLGRSGVAA